MGCSSTPATASKHHSAVPRLRDLIASVITSPPTPQDSSSPTAQRQRHLSIRIRMETEARVAGFHPRTEIRSRNTQTIRPITPQSRRALRVGVAPRLRGAASSASTNPTKTRANPRAAPNRRRGSTALDHGKTIQASAGRSRQPRGDNRGITAHAAQPPQAAREQRCPPWG